MTPFSARLPTIKDASAKRCVLTLSDKGRLRVGLFDWTNSAESWRQNGFIAWSPLPLDDPREAGTDVGEKS